jgi:pimeloyl-ACP methyl ester carboxylesterase
MRRVLASNRQANLFHAAFKACNDYANGLQAMTTVACPVLFVLGRKDQMTPARAAQSLVGACRRAQVVTLEVGHQMMLEAPDGTLFALRDFLRA